VPRWKDGGHVVVVDEGLGQVGGAGQRMMFFLFRDPDLIDISGFVKME
jgi:hypothetical protein